MDYLNKRKDGDPADDEDSPEARMLKIPVKRLQQFLLSKNDKQKAMKKRELVLYMAGKYTVSAVFTYLKELLTKEGTATNLKDQVNDEEDQMPTTLDDATDTVEAEAAHRHARVN